MKKTGQIYFLQTENKSPPLFSAASLKILMTGKSFNENHF